MTDRPMTDAELEELRGELASDPDFLGVAHVGVILRRLLARHDAYERRVGELAESRAEIVAQRNALADRIRELEADAINLNHLRRGLCEILGDNLDQVDTLLYAVSAMRDDADSRVERVEAERDRLHDIIESAHDGQTSSGEPTTHAAALREIIEQRDACSALVAERDRLREALREALERLAHAGHHSDSWLRSEVRRVLAEQGGDRG